MTVSTLLDKFDLPQLGLQTKKGLVTKRSESSKGRLFWDPHYQINNNETRITIDTGTM